MTIPKLTPYTGQVANPDGSQTQTEFTQNMFDQLSYEAQLATQLDATIDGMNQAVTDVESNAAEASASATAAEASASTAGYQGLWPDTGGSALKGETWQTQVGGTPTGEYYTALQNTGIDPVGDNVNWKRNGDINRDNLSDYTDMVYKASGGNSAVENMIDGVPITAKVGDICSTGGTMWERVAESEPSVIGDFIPLNGLCFIDFGGSRDPSFDNSQVFSTIGTLMTGNHEIILPDYLLPLGSTAVIPQNMSLSGVSEISSGFYASIGFTGTLLSTYDGGLYTNSNIDKLTLDGSGLADRILHVPLASRSSIKNLRALNTIRKGIEIGDEAGSNNCVEVNLRDIRIETDQNTGNDPSTSIGLSWTRCTDCAVDYAVIIGFARGEWKKSRTSAIESTKVHAWNRQGNGPLVECFRYEGSKHTGLQCYADTPTPNGDVTVTDCIGFFINGFDIELVAPRIYVNDEYGEDDRATAIRFGDSIAFCSLIGGTASADLGIKFKKVIDINPSVLRNLDLHGFNAEPNSYYTPGIENDIVNARIKQNRTYSIYSKDISTYNVYNTYTTFDGDAVELQNIANLNTTPSSRWFGVDVSDPDITSGKGAYKVLPFGGSVYIGSTNPSSNVGFFGVSPVGRQTVTGSTTDTALLSLIDALDKLGLINDNLT